jgi:hypothetical protein
MPVLVTGIHALPLRIVPWMRNKSGHDDLRLLR